jgi:hypothetical protein
MIKKVSDINLWEVDFLVAKAEGLDPITDGINHVMVQYQKVGITRWKPYSPTTNQSQAWPIIERESISIKYDDMKDQWTAQIFIFAGDATTYFEQTGKTSLEAAMRCYVASKFGDEVEL